LRPQNIVIAPLQRNIDIGRIANGKNIRAVSDNPGKETGRDKPTAIGKLQQRKVFAWLSVAA
jgi:hypothetical protein